MSATVSFLVSIFLHLYIYNLIFIYLIFLAALHGKACRSGQRGSQGPRKCTRLAESKSIEDRIRCIEEEVTRPSITKVKYGIKDPT